MEAVNNKNIEKAITGILFDQILWYRVTKGLEAISNCVHPSQPEEMFEPDSKYTGSMNAYLILGVSSNRDIVDMLNYRLYDMMMDSEQSAIILAKEIYQEWLLDIKNYYINRKEVVLCKI